MSHDPTQSNPYESPNTTSGAVAESAELTTLDWVLCIFCGGIACIIGIVRLIQGKPNGGKMILYALLFSFLWGIVRVVLEAIAEGPP